MFKVVLHNGVHFSNLPFVKLFEHNYDLVGKSVVETDERVEVVKISPERWTFVGYNF